MKDIKVLFLRDVVGWLAKELALEELYSYGWSLISVDDGYAYLERPAQAKSQPVVPDTQVKVATPVKVRK